MTVPTEPISGLKSGIARKLIISILLFSLIVTLVITSFQLYTDHSDALEEVDIKLEEIETRHLQSIINSMWVTDYALVEMQLEGILQTPDIQYIVVSRQGKNIITVGTPKSDKIVSRDYPLEYFFKGRHVLLGMLRVTANLEGIYSKLLNKGLVILINNAIEIFLVSTFLFFLFYILVGKHLTTMSEYTKQLGFDSLDKVLVLERTGNTRDELDQLVISINSMREGLAREVTERKQTVNALRVSEEKFSKAFRSSPTLISISTLEEGRFIEVNNAFQDVCGFSREEVIGRTSLGLNLWADSSGQDNLLHMLREHGVIHNEETRLRIKSGELLSVLYSAEMIDIEGETCVLAVILDISDRKKLEDRLLHSQKIESIGTLAGGIAHDFNNILTTIIGYASLLGKKLSHDDSMMFYIDQINTASEKATQLTKGLLAFSRKQDINTAPHDLNEIIRKLKDFLLRIIGEDIEFNTVLTDDDLTTMVDTGQLEQVLMNLVTNARDSMPKGGALTITTKSVTLDESFIKAYGFGEQGSYAVISVSDTGTGMEEETREKIFEPFFTTKDQGKGTGLGLSMVYGIIKQHNGHIIVYSEPGRGTNIRIYLPLTNKSIEEAEEKKPKAAVSFSGTETILVAEDDAMIREIISTVLQESGYTAIVAEDGEDAVNKFIENKENIKFIILDAIMPKKYGSEAFKEIKQIRPDIKGIFLSGYTNESIDQKNLPKDGMKLISKPISPDNLLRIVRSELDN